MKKFYYIVFFLGFSLFVTAQAPIGTRVENVRVIKKISTEEIAPPNSAKKTNATAKLSATTTTVDTNPTGNSDQVGITEGQLSVSLTGGASYSIPIAVPPGINGVVPQVGLVYNSQGGNGIAGYGWEISGVSAITRIARTKFHDGVVGGVNLDANDRFALDGQRLILKTVTVYGSAGTTYETENFSNTKITAIGVSPLGANYGPATFKVEYPDGSVAYYGNDDSSRSITAWGISQWENSQGVRISYSYDANFNIKEIKYGTKGTADPINKIQFIYAPCARAEQAYVGGQSITQTDILKQIKVIGNAVDYRNYTLEHVPTDFIYEQLKKITETSGVGNKSYNPTVFSYEKTIYNLNHQLIPLDAANESVSSVKDKTITGDFDGDGSMDYVHYPVSEYEKNKFTLFNNINGYGYGNGGYEVNVGFYQDIFASNWLTVQNKVDPGQGITTVRYIDNPAGNVSFDTYTLYAGWFYNVNTKIVNFPTSEIPSGCLSDTDCTIAYTPQFFPKKFLSGDFNGDGMTDVIAIDNAPLTTYGCGPYNSGDCVSVYNSQSFSREVYFVDLRGDLTTNFLSAIGNLESSIDGSSDVQVIDFNGDGRSDFMIRENGSIYVYTMNENNELVKLASIPYDSDISLNKLFLIGDYNGDGKSDFLVNQYAQANDNHTEWIKYTSTGKGFIKQYQNYPNLKYPPTISNNKFAAYMPMDYDNDGKTDLVSISCTTVGTLTANIKVNVTYNKNGFFNYVENYGVNINTLNLVNQSGFDHLSIPIFYKSTQPNRKLEIALRRNNSLLYFQSQKDFSIDKLLSTITTGNGVKETITYRPLMNIDNDGVNVYTPELEDTPTYPNINIISGPTFQVVSMLEKQSASGYKKQLFAYAGGTSNMEGLGFLGFKSSMRTNWFNDNDQIITTVSKFNPNLRGANIENYTYQGLAQPQTSIHYLSPTTGVPNNITISDYTFTTTDIRTATGKISILPGQNGTIIKPTNSTDTFVAKIFPNYDSTGFTETNTSPRYNLISKSLLFYESSLSSSKVYKLQNVQSKNYNILANTSDETNVAYDEFNNPIESITKLKNGGVDEQTTISTVAYEPPILSPYMVNRPKSKTETVIGSGDSMTSKEAYTYGSGTESNLLKKIEKWGNNTGSITEENVYDAFGNITQKKIAAGSIVRTTNYEYNPASPYNGRFLTKSSDVEGLATTFVYNATNGVLDSETNPYGLTTTYLHDDPWFKKTKTIDYLGNTNTYAYIRQTEKTKITTTGSDGSYSEELFDELGRKIRSGIKDIQDHMSYKDFQYDIYDRNYNISEPHTGSPSLWNTTVYDVYGRLETVTDFTGKVASVQYDKLTTTATDNSKPGYVKKTTKNAMGNVVKLEETPGGVINYSYFANGNLKETDYSGTKITITQDGWGRKTSLTDPSAGTYTYEYNGLGEQTKETTPNGTTTYTLDPTTGKLTNKTIVGTNPTYTNSSTVYTYNTQANNKLLQKTEFTDLADANKKNTIEYTYDTAKRLISTKETTGYGAEFKKTIEYYDSGEVYLETSEAKLNGKTSTTSVQHDYKNGFPSSMEDSGNTVAYWKTDEVNARGQLTKATLGNGIKIENTYDDNDFGYFKTMKHSLGTGTIMELGTVFHPQRGNLMSRTNSLFGTNEVFEYDNQDRLTKYPNALGVQVEQTYEEDGRIKANTLGEYKYANAAKKYQNTSVLLSPEATGYYADREGIFSDSMEDKKGWAIPDTAVFTYDATQKHLGNTSLKIANTTTGEKVIHSESWIKIDNTAPTSYTYSAWVKSDAPQAELFLFMKTATETNYFTLVNSAYTDVKNKWVRIEATFLVPANIKKLSLRLDNNGLGNVWFDDVMIRKTSNIALVNKEIPDIAYKDRQLNIKYNAFKSPYEIEEAGVDKLSFVYNDNNSRSAMFYGSLDTNKELRPIHKHYSADGTMEIKQNIQTGEIEFVTYIGGDGYSAPVVYKKNFNVAGTIINEQTLYLHRDYQGSILAITNKDGVVLEKRLFDAWGAIIKVQDGNGNVLNGLTILDRGYTGHEHLQSVGLIHMNGRLYDPKLHRFLQPDNYVQDPTNTQNYNRYGYCWNNPLKYTDPSGEFFFVAMIVGAIIGAYIGGSKANDNWNPIKWDWSSGKTWAGIGTGAVIGAVAGEVAWAGITGQLAFGTFSVSLGVGVAVPGVGTLGIMKSGEYINSQYTNPQGQTYNQNIGTVPVVKPKTIDDTESAKDHYYNGNGSSVNIGNNTLALLQSSSEYNYVLNRLMNGSANQISSHFDVDMTWRVFHIGTTNVDYKTTYNGYTATTTFTGFVNDGFWDPDYINEFNYNYIIPYSGFRPDGKGPNLEAGGTPYNYIPRTWKVQYPNPNIWRAPMVLPAYGPKRKN